MSTSLLDLPSELMEEILVLCDPVDVAQATMVCRRLYGVVYGDYEKEATESEARTRRKVFWRVLYLNQSLDDLRRCVDWLGTPRILSVSSDTNDATVMEGPPGEDIDWRVELQRIIRARCVASNVKCCKGERDLREVLATFLELARWVPAARGDSAKNLLWVPIMMEGFLDSVEKGIPPTPSDSGQPQPSWILPPKTYWQKETKQLHAQLHTLYGLTGSDLTNRRRRESLAWVYDMRKYTRANEYGPLRDGGKRVDWEFLERIHHVISMHVVSESLEGLVQSGIFESDSGLEEEPGFEYLLYPMSMPFTQARFGAQEGGETATGVRMVEVEPFNEEGAELPENADWAGIGGDWTIYFCFYDHRDLIALNQSADPETGHLDVSLFGGEVTEVFKKIEVTLHVTRVANDSEHPGKPIIGFLGMIQAPSNSTMHGVVQLTADNYIKYQFYSSGGGSATWSSVGIQVGGIGSSFGVLGSWTTVFHDEGDPVGPFWMRKQISTKHM